MTRPTTPTDLLAHALLTLERLQSTEMEDPAEALVQAAREALSEAQTERGALLAVAEEARGLVETLDEYNEAIEAGQEERIADLAEAGAEAEATLVDALNKLYLLHTGQADLSGEQAHLAAMNRLVHGAGEEPSR